MTEETIQDNASPRKYYGTIPHMAGAKLDVYEHRLYCHYIEICGISKTDTCTQAERTIYTTIGMSKQRFLKARTGLADKKFITFRPGKPNKKGQKGYAAHTTILDIWEENIQFCKARPYTGQILPVEGVNNYPLKGSDITPSNKYKKLEKEKTLSPKNGDSTQPLEDDAIQDEFECSNCFNVCSIYEDGLTTLPDERLYCQKCWDSPQVRTIAFGYGNLDGRYVCTDCGQVSVIWDAGSNWRICKGCYQKRHEDEQVSPMEDIPIKVSSLVPLCPECNATLKTGADGICLNCGCHRYAPDSSYVINQFAEIATIEDGHYRPGPGVCDRCEKFTKKGDGYHSHCDSDIELCEDCYRYLADSTMQNVHNAQQSENIEQLTAEMATALEDLPFMRTSVVGRRHLGVIEFLKSSNLLEYNHPLTRMLTPTPLGHAALEAYRESCETQQSEDRFEPEQLPPSDKPKAKKPPTPHTLMKNALVTAMGYKEDDITAWGEYNKASKMLRDGGATPDDMMSLYSFTAREQLKGGWEFKSPVAMATRWPEYQKQLRQQAEHGVATTPQDKPFMIEGVEE